MNRFLLCVLIILLSFSTMAEAAPVFGVTLDTSSAHIHVDTSEQLTTRILPDSATNKNVTWSSSNTGVATVNASGLVTAISPGIATISVRTEDGGHTATCEVTVPSVPSIRLNRGATFILTGETEQLAVIATPADADINLIWESHDTSVATVNASGLVTGVSPGVSMITVRMDDDDRRTLTCKVTVTHPGADVPVTGVALDHQSTIMTLGMGILYGEMEILFHTLMPANATNRNVTWSSSNPAVAALSSPGWINGVSPGTAIITVTTEDGGFTATCTVTVIEGDIQRAWHRNSSSKSETAAKTIGFGEDDFEIVDGNVVIKKSIAETIARKLLGTDDIEATPLPWFEAAILRSGQNGKIAAVGKFVTESMLKMEAPFRWSEVLILNIISPDTGEFLEFTGWHDIDGFDDGKFMLEPLIPAPGLTQPEHAYILYVFIRDGGRFDLDKTENGLVVGQLAIVGKARPEREPATPGSSGCNAGYGGILLLLTSLGLLIINRTREKFTAKTQ